jgi:large subunit ribosomal protein L35
MPKIKTHRGAAKRFSLTGTGRVKRAKAFASHILTSKSPKRKRNMRRSAVADKTNEAALKRLLPYL